MKYVIKILCCILWVGAGSATYSQITVSFSSLQYVDGTPIFPGDNIVLQEGGSETFNFNLAIQNPTGDLPNGTIAIYTEKPATAGRVSRFSVPYNSFPGQDFYSQSGSFPLSATEFPATGGILYAEFEPTVGIAYVSGNYSIVVDPGGGGDDCLLDPPTGLSNGDITNVSANFFWGPVSGVSGYEVRYAEAGGSYSTISVSSSSTFTTASGLTPDREHVWSIRSLCSDGDASDWSPSENFRTLANCFLASTTGLNSFNITETSADLSWIPTSGATGYRIQYKEATATSYNSTGIITGTSFTLDGLNSDTTYDWRIRGRCASGVFTDNWSVVAQFTTLPLCAEDLTITDDVLTGQTDFQESELTLQALNKVFNSATAEYDTGTTLTLLPGFEVEAGATFRAYIDGCVPPSEAPELVDAPTLTLPEPPSEIGFELFPNPARDEITIQTTENALFWEIYDQMGLKLHESPLQSRSSHRVSHQIGQWRTGIYFVRVHYDNGEVLSKTLIKQ